MEMMAPLSDPVCPLESIHAALIQKHIHVDIGSPASALTTAILLILLGSAVCLLGARLAKPFLCTVTACLSAYVAQSVLFSVKACLTMPCWAGSSVVLVALLLGAAVGAFMMDTAFFCAGAALGIAVTQVLFNAIPQMEVNVGNLPLFEGHAIFPFWTVALVAAIVFGCLLYRLQHEALALISAFLGACTFQKGIAMCLASQAQPPLPPPAPAAIAIVAFVVGAVFQMHHERRAKNALASSTQYIEYSNGKGLLRP